MSSFSVSMAFNQQDLERFYATGTNVVIAKPTGGGTPNVAWVVYRPLMSNTVSWTENYGIYVSNAEVQNGATLVQMSATPYPAVASMLYTLTASGSILGPTSGGTQNSYTIINAYNNLPKGYLTMGLFQSANVNGTEVLGGAVSAAPVIYNSSATMTPFTIVYVWTQSQVLSNTVVTNVTSPMTQLQLSATNNTANLLYNASSGTFIPVSSNLKALADNDPIHELVSVRLPLL
jgi:hypothetical protein